MGKTPQKLRGKTLASLIKDRQDKVLKVMDKHGVTFCAGCYLTLTSPVEKAASYHAVPHVEKFLKDLEKALAA